MDEPDSSEAFACNVDGAGTLRLPVVTVPPRFDTEIVTVSPSDMEAPEGVGMRTRAASRVSTRGRTQSEDDAFVLT